MLPLLTHFILTSYSLCIHFTFYFRLPSIFEARWKRDWSHHLSLLSYDPAILLPSTPHWPNPLSISTGLLYAAGIIDLYFSLYRQENNIELSKGISTEDQRIV
jgi:hypothetical protein